MERGRRCWIDSLATARERCAAQRALLPQQHRRLDAERYEVDASQALLELREAAALDARRRHGLGPAAPGN
jgi:hypothetical protein